MVARLVAVEKRARSSRSLSAAVRTRMPAALRRQRAGSGKNGSCLWNCGNCFSTMPQTKTMGSTHWRASGALITWTTLRRPVSRGKGLGVGALFTAGQESSIAISRAGSRAEAASASARSKRRSTADWLRHWSARSCVAGSAGGAGRKRWRSVEKRAAQFAGESAKPRHSSSAASDSSLWSRRSGPGLAFAGEEQRAQLAEAGVGDLLAHGEIEAIRGGEIGKARGEAQDGEGAGVVPAAEHGFDGAREEAHHGVAIERHIEIEARRDAEAFQGGAQRGNVDLGSAHDDADLAEGASGGGLLENAAGDLFDLAFDARRLDEG